jgi:energy-coupling factor transporter ATP-binding protein EcfA2
MRKAIIQFNHFNFQYRAQSEPTLHDIQLTLYEGEKILIVGPSGSGKSTLAHCINGLIPFFYSGEIKGSLTITDRDLQEMSIFQLSEEVGTVLQDPDGQFVGLTVEEDIAFKLENRGVPQADMIEKVTAAARAVDIYTHLGASPHSLSGGQKQRTTLGGVMVDDVGILLFDEPLANLDPFTGMKTVELIDRIHKETGKTIIIIEHRLEDVLHCDVDRIIVMKEGRIIADTTANELLCSEILRDTGIREPLYISALRYAGCEITPEMNPKSMSSIQLDSCTDKLQAWYDNHDSQPTQLDRPPIIELKDVAFSYEKGTPIICNISLRIDKGEMISIVGRNGAGKSTVSKLICGFHQPTSGQILYMGRDMSQDTIKERAQRIGFVMQNPNHMISKTLIFDEVALGLKVRGTHEDEQTERVHKVLKVCGLYEFRSWPISALSFGQKKRVTIASILVLNPEVIILDEPTAGQDFKHYNEMMEFLLQLNRLGMTVIIITHDMHLMLEYAERTIVLADGSKISDDSPAHVLTDVHIVKAANLKETSLYELAVRSGMDHPREFVRRFIEHDRGVRGR